MENRVEGFLQPLQAHQCHRMCRIDKSNKVTIVMNVIPETRVMVKIFMTLIDIVQIFIEEQKNGFGCCRREVRSGDVRPSLPFPEKSR